MRAAAVVLLLVLAACGGGSDEPASQRTTTAAPTAAATTKPTTATPRGKPAPEALMRFQCVKDDKKGSWKATGFLVNGGKAAVTFQVTVHIGEATGGQEQAKTKQVPNVAPGGSVAFTINKVPAPEDGGTCHVQVLAS